MPIKTSSLENKRRYRGVKTIIFLLPIIVIARMFIAKKRTFPQITRFNIPEVMKINYLYLIYGALGYGAYALIISGLRKLIIYIGFGGMERDAKKNDARIKKSYLERKVLYRIAKVLYGTLPLAALIILTTRGYIDISNLTIDKIAKSNYAIGAGVAAIILYYTIIAGFRKIVLYIGRGGIVDDTKPVTKPTKPIKASRASRYIIQQAPIQEEKKENRGWMRLLFIIMFYVASYSAVPKFSSLSSLIGTPAKKSQCIPTGCGNDRRSSCTNGCYTSQSACMQAGDCSSKTCRRCP